MNNNYDVKISCGSYLKRALDRAMSNEKMDKEFHISGDVSLADVQSVASRIAVSTYGEKLDTALKEGNGRMSEGVANALIFSDEKLISAVSASLQGDEPSFEIYDQERLEQAMKPIEVPTNKTM